jgi:hypothetical protein
MQLGICIDVCALNRLYFAALGVKEIEQDNSGRHYYCSRVIDVGSAALRCQ